jgi:tRNA(Ile)-lysidine synthase
MDCNTESISLEEYSQLIFPFKGKIEKQSAIAVAVSGGADSLALLWLTSRWLRAQNPSARCIAISVNHHLRLESTQEMVDLYQLIKQWDIEHVVLEWNGKKPHSGIQTKARQARYDLIQQWCYDQKITCVLLGHHLQDQIETFISRLCHGSSFYGLACMSPSRQEGDLFFIRPLLNIPKERLKSTLRQFHLNWIEDPSNRNRIFERVKIRDFCQNFSLDHMQRISTIIEKFAIFRNVIDERVTKFFHHFVQIEESGYLKIPFSSLEKQPWIEIERILEKSLRLIGGKTGFFRSKSLRKLWKDLQEATLVVKTYGGCILQKKSNILWIYCEPSSLKDQTRKVEATSFQWDHRFHLIFTGENLKLESEKWLVKTLNLAGWKTLSKDHKKELLKKGPLYALLTIPVIWKDDKVIYIPWVKEENVFSYRLIFKSIVFSSL